MTADLAHFDTRGPLARKVDMTPHTMRGATRKATHTGSRESSRRRQRGFTTVEEVLIIAALFGCFVYPMSLAARSTGQQIAVQMESAHKTLLTQR